MKKIQWRAVGILVGLLVLGLFLAPNTQAQQPPIQVGVGEAVTIAGTNVSKIAIADPAVADVVPLSDKELSIIGKKAGITTLTIVKSDGSPTQLSRIEVVNDAVVETIRQMIGNNNITVRAIGDTLVLDGKVNDEIEAQRAAQVAAAYKPQVVNLLEVTKPRQIKVRTRIAQVNTDAIKNIGFQWFGPQGQVQYAMQYIGGGSILSGFIPTKSEFGGGGGAINPTTVTMTLLLDLLIQKSYARVLSEPTLVTFSGKEASFLVGQEIPIAQTLANSFTIEFKQVGVRMKIKPTADSDNRINTTIHAEVSQITGGSVNGIPIIATKSADTTLQVNDGQTIVIGGLLENNISKDILRKLPWLADIPIFGALFRDKQFEQSKSEVLFFMTPEVIKDINADFATAAQSPGLQHWVATWNKGGVVPAPDKKDDWGLHDPNGLGLPEHKKSKGPAKVTGAKPAATPAAVAKPAATESKAATDKAPVEQPVEKPAEKPAVVTPAPDTTSNFTPARPAQ
jgi:pilus assembly protein CpaC